MDQKENDKKLAQELFKMTETVDLLRRFLVENDTPSYPEKHVEMSNEQVGEWTRANMLAQNKIAIRWARLQNLASGGEGVSTNVAPE